MGRIRSALQSLYDQDEAWKKVEPAVHVIRLAPRSSDNDDDRPKIADDELAELAVLAALEEELLGNRDQLPPNSAEVVDEDCTEPVVIESLDREQEQVAETEPHAEDETLVEEPESAPLESVNVDDIENASLVDESIEMEAIVDPSLETAANSEPVRAEQTEFMERNACEVEPHETLEDATEQESLMATGDEAAQEESSLAATSPADAEDAPAENAVDVDAVHEHVSDEQVEQKKVKEQAQQEQAQQEQAQQEQAWQDDASEVDWISFETSDQQELQQLEDAYEGQEEALRSAVRNDSEDAVLEDAASSASAFEFDDSPEDSPIFGSESEVDASAGECELASVEDASSVDDSDIDESEQVLRLVQEVLGISPEIRFESVESIENERTDATVTDDESNLATTDSGELAATFFESSDADEAFDEFELSGEVADIQSPGEMEFVDQQPDQDAVQSTSIVSAPAEVETAGDSVFQPVMQTWASIPVEPKFEPESPLRGDASPPLSNTPNAEEDTSRQSESLAEALIVESDSMAPMSLESSSSGSDGATTEAPEQESPSVEESEFPLPPVEEQPDPGSTATQAWSPATGVLAKLPEKTAALAFERTIAERVLETDFGVHVQEMSQRLTRELTNEPAVVLFLSLEPNDQRADILAGLAMHLCAQRDAPTLLVDADVRSQWISRQFEQTETGLVEAIEDDVPWYDSVVATSCENLRLLRCGMPDQLIRDGQQIHDASVSLFRDWKSSFGLVLIDGGAVDGPLVPSLSELSDAAYLTVQLGSDEREELRRATQRLSIRRAAQRLYHHRTDELTAAKANGKYEFAADKNRDIVSGMAVATGDCGLRINNKKPAASAEPLR